MTVEFDPAARERELRAEADAWDTAAPVDAEPGDIPVIDLGDWLADGDPDALDEVGALVRDAEERVGFFQLVGHGVDPQEIADIFEWSRRFHALSFETKQRINIDNPDHPLGGVGYLPIGERRLPRRAKGNRNAAFLMKSDKAISFDDNQWLPDEALPGFRAGVEHWARRIEGVALQLLPAFATSLELAPDFFAPAFEEPFWRLRLTHYPPDELTEQDLYGIAPHVDTTFFTLLVQDSPGLTVFSADRKQWLRVPYVPGAIVVNSGELLRQWSNDRFLSARHFANNASDDDRYSIPLFFNASGDWPMECLPTCHGPGNPPKYPTISYNESQAVAQGE